MLLLILTVAMTVAIAYSFCGKAAKPLGCARRLSLTAPFSSGCEVPVGQSSTPTTTPTTSGRKFE